MSGPLDPGAYTRLRVDLLTSLAEQPHALVCDLSGLTNPDLRCLDLLIAAATQCSEWPGVPWVLAGADPGTVAALALRQDAHDLPVFRTLDMALAHVGSATPLPVARLSMPPVPESVRLARRAVTDACRDWSAEEYVWAATLVASELVTNAIVHTGTAPELRLAYRPGELRLSVRDGLGDSLTRLTPTDEQNHGRGLLMVHTLARSWGVLPARPGGKVVWCVLTDGDGDGALESSEAEQVGSDSTSALDRIAE